MISLSDTEALKLCPFCGGKALLENTITQASIMCCDCPAVMRRDHTTRSFDDGTHRVIAAWNHRLASSTPEPVATQAPDASYETLIKAWDALKATDEFDKFKGTEALRSSLAWDAFCMGYRAALSTLPTADAGPVAEPFGWIVLRPEDSGWEPRFCLTEADADDFVSFINVNPPAHKMALYAAPTPSLPNSETPSRELVEKMQTALRFIADGHPCPVALAKDALARAEGGS